jgi:hypothetical protein
MISRNAFTLTLVMLKPLWIGLPQILFMTFSVLLDLSTLLTIHCALFHNISSTHYLIWKDQTFCLGPNVEATFQSLKVSFIIVPLLAHVNK